MTLWSWRMPLCSAAAAVRILLTPLPCRVAVVQTLLDATSVVSCGRCLAENFTELSQCWREGGSGDGGEVGSDLDENIVQRLSGGFVFGGWF